MCICIYKMRLFIRPSAQHFLICDAMKTRKTTVIPPTRVTHEEKEKIKKMAETYGLNVSEYMRQAALAQEMKGQAEAATIVKLSKINADQARLGNLLKLALDSGVDLVEIKRVVKEISIVQQELKEAVLRV